MRNAGQHDKAATEARTQVAVCATVEPLTPDQIWREADFGGRAFKSTKEIEPYEGVIEQERAVRAIELGVSINRKNFNVFMAGYSGTGRMTVVRNILKRVAPTRSVPNDWAYVNNFQELDYARALSFAPGQAKAFQQQVRELIESLTKRVPQAFHAKEHQQRVQKILNQSAGAENEAFRALADEAEGRGFLIRATKTGLVTLPVVDGEPLSSVELAELSAKQLSKIEKQRAKVEPFISAYLERSRDIQLETHAQIEKVQVGLGRKLLSPIFKKIKSRWKKLKPVVAFLDSMEADILEHLGTFLQDETETDQFQAVRDEIARRYDVNIVVDHSETEGAPIVIENHPTFFRLFGKVEKRVVNGVLSTDLSLIRAGAIAKANGGYLVINSADLFSHPLVWENLKAVLRSGEVAIEDVAEQTTFVPTSGLRPQPIPVDLKVILVGPPRHYDILFRDDPDFRKMFQVKVEFDTEIARAGKTEMEIARFVATTCKNESLRPTTRDGVSAVVEEASRMVGDQDRLTLRFNAIANLLIESDYQAGKSRSRQITRKHVSMALLEREERSGLIERKMMDAILDGQVLIDSSGEATGQVNGLAVYDVGEYAFGKPARITAVTYVGTEGVTNVERESLLSGRIHDKGVLILGGWLGSKYAQTGPLALNVSITMEQSYGPVDGDSASAAELFAVISSLSGVPIRQDLAVTGSVNQMGEIQPVGGVNQKIEGFFGVCEKQGLTGKQGVIIPVQNVRHLMLQEDVRKAVTAGRFHVYPMTTVDEGLELLTGMSPKEIHRRAAYHLEQYQELSRRHSKDK